MTWYRSLKTKKNPEEACSTGIKKKIPLKPFIWDESLAAEDPACCTVCGEQPEEHLLQSAHLSISFFFSLLSILLSCVWALILCSHCVTESSFCYPSNTYKEVALFITREEENEKKEREFFCRAYIFWKPTRIEPKNRSYFNYTLVLPSLVNVVTAILTNQMIVNVTYYYY